MMINDGPKRLAVVAVGVSWYSIIAARQEPPPSSIWKRKILFSNLFLKVLQHFGIAEVVKSNLDYLAAFSGCRALMTSGGYVWNINWQQLIPIIQVLSPKLHEGVHSY